MPRPFTFLLALGMVALPALLMAKDKELNDLKDLRWKNRVILLSVPKEKELILTELEKQDAAIKDRDILWFVFDGKVTHTNYQGKVSELFTSKVLSSCIKSDIQSVLIGKDGGVKRSAKDVDLKAMFSLIDTMPMRRNEMGE